jgi:hypothetical protein
MIMAAIASACGISMAVPGPRTAWKAMSQPSPGANPHAPMRQ